MKLYVASHSRDAAQKVRDKIVKMGHVCTSRWIDYDEEFEHGDHSVAEKRRLAIMDEADVRAATGGLILIASAKGQNVPGGKHVETGLALAYGLPVYVLGRRENIFHWHPRVRVFSGCGQMLAYMGRRRRCAEVIHKSHGDETRLKKAPC